MKSGKEIDKWYPFFIDKWLWGSTRHELIVKKDEDNIIDLRGIWMDLLTLSRKDDGWIRANENTPYPLKQLAGYFCVPLNMLELTIKKCIKFGKLSEPSAGIYYVNSTGDYSFSDRHKYTIQQKNSQKNEVCSQKDEHTSQNTEAILYNKREENIIKKENNIKEKDENNSEELFSDSKIKVQDVIDYFNKNRGSLSECTRDSKNKTLAGKIKTRLKDKDWFDSFKKALDHLKPIPNVTITIDTMVKNDGYTYKVLEGAFDFLKNRQTKSGDYRPDSFDSDKRDPDATFDLSTLPVNGTDSMPNTG